MLKIGLNTQLNYNNLPVNTGKIGQNQILSVKLASNPAVSFKSQNNISCANYPNPAVSTVLRTPPEQKAYSRVCSVLTKENQKKLDFLLKSGRLLSADSNDNSTTLDNLNKILKEERAPGLDSAVILNELVSTLANPFTITQKFGDIPSKFADEIVRQENIYRSKQPIPGNKSILGIIKEPNQNEIQSVSPISRADLEVISSCCAAASIEFTLADKQPAEFARIVSDLSSPKLSSTKKLKVKDVAENTVDAFWLLNEFNTKYKAKSWNEVDVEIKPDRNAIIRARIQSRYKDPLERSAVDVLMQSLIMNLGSQHTYNAIDDKRSGKFNSDNAGLTDIEKNFVESIILAKPTVSVTYQKIDDNMKISGYECDFATMKKHITDALALGKNVIIGYTHVDSEGRVRDGHEITIMDITRNEQGKEIFVCNDTDDNLSEPVFYEVDKFLPKIHHAGLPKEVLKNDVQFVESWVELVQELKAKRAAEEMKVS